jgi:hypothetical protein
MASSSSSALLAGGAGGAAAAAAAAPGAAAAPPAAAAAPRGLAASSRTWKAVRTVRTSAFSRAAGAAPPARKGVKSGAFNTAMANKRARSAGRDMGLRLKAEAAAAKAQRRERRAENERRRAENSLRSTQYTEVTDSRKIKKMNKRQLLQLQKTATDKFGNTVLVPAFGKGSTGGGRGKQVPVFRKR